MHHTTNQLSDNLRATSQGVQSINKRDGGGYKNKKVKRETI